jgi:hypothetical protein
MSRFDQGTGQQIEAWYCYGMPNDPLTIPERDRIAKFAADFEECDMSVQQLVGLDDHQLIRVAYCAMADYASGQI